MSSEPVTPGSVGAIRLTKVYDRLAAHQPWRHLLSTSTPAPLAPVTALDRVDLSIHPGERVGLIGPNGSGKSTLLKVLCGVTSPTAGRVHIGGRVGAMIELGLGFHPDLTGWENGRAAAAIAGLDPQETAAILPAVAEFAELGEAMDAPLRHYSTGMTSRLGFALATHVPADLLLVDEVLAVGDPLFQEKCIARIDQLCGAGMTLVLVSHEMWLVDSVCDRVIHLDGGTVVDDGGAASVIDRYLRPEPGAARMATRPPVRFRTLGLGATDVSAATPLEIEAELEVDDDPTGAAIDTTDIEVTVSLARIAPDLPIAVTRQRLATAALVDGARLHGTCSPIPADTGLIEVRVRLLDVRRGEALDERRTEVWIGRELVGRRPQLLVDVEAELTPAPSRPRAPVATPVTVPAGDVVGRLDGVSKRFHQGRRTLDRRVLPGRFGRDTGGSLLALDDVSLTLTRHRAVGLIGPNGAGKTTLLKLLAGTLAPSRGTVTSAGRVVSMLELGLGFHPDLSGRQNLDLSGRLLGMTAADLVDRLPQVLEMADLGDAVDAPLRQYSSGMRARLGLALALHADPDLLLVDEALAVGDEHFRHRAVLAVDELRRNGAGIVFVSHDLALVALVCDRIVRLDQGRVTDDGPASELLADRTAAATGGAVRRLSAVRLDELTLSRHRVTRGGTLEATAIVETSEPTPWLRLELRYLVLAGASDIDQRLVEPEHTIVVHVIEPAGGRLASVGRHECRVRVSGNQIHGDVGVALVAVDERDEQPAALCWQPVTFGNPRPDTVTPVSVPLEVRWRVEPRTA